MRALEGALLHDPVAVRDLVVNRQACVRERAQPAHCVAGLCLSPLELDLAGRLEHAVLTVQLADAGLVVSVERIDEPRADLSGV